MNMAHAAELLEWMQTEREKCATKEKDSPVSRTRALAGHQVKRFNRWIAVVEAAIAAEGSKRE